MSTTLRPAHRSHKLMVNDELRLWNPRTQRFEVCMNDNNGKDIWIWNSLLMLWELEDDYDLPF